MREEMRPTGVRPTGARILPFRPPGEGTPESPLRRRRVVVRHMRRHPLLLLAKPFLMALVLVGGPLAVSAWIFRSPVFMLSELDVETEEQGRVSATWVHQALRPAYGWNLPRLPLAWVDETLRRHPWVKATDLRKDLPGRLRVKVIEKQEVALLRPLGDFPQRDAAGQGGAGPEGADAQEGEEAALWYLDADGEGIAPLAAGDGAADLLLVSSGSPDLDLRPALELAGEIEEVAPGWAPGLSEIEVLGAEDFRVWSADLPFPLLVRSGTLAEKTAYLEALLPQIASRYGAVEAVDLRFARKIILQPTVRNRGSGGGTVPGIHQRGLGG